MWNRSFLYLWCGQAISQIGNRVYVMALAWYFVSILGDTSAVLTLFIISSLPSLLLGVFIGPVVEKYNKKHLVIISDLVSGILTALLAFMVYAGHAASWRIYAICFLLNTVNLFFSPSVNSILPSLMSKEQYRRGTSIMKMVTFLSQIMGAAVGGVLVGFLGVFWSIFINAVSFLFSALMSSGIAFIHKKQERSGRYMQNLREGLEYMASRPLLRNSIVLAVLINLFIPSFIVFVPIIIKTEMNMNAVHYGIVDAAIPMGALVASLVLSFRKDKGNSSIMRIVVQCIFGLSAAYMLSAITQNYLSVLLAGLLFGFFTNNINVHVLTFLMGTVENRFVGRVFSLFESLSYASISLSYVLATILVSSLNIYVVMFINGACLLLIAAGTIFANKTNYQ